jgi:hypothetical protein
MKRAFLAQLASNEQHLQHTALEMAAWYLQEEIEAVVLCGFDQEPREQERMSEEDREQAATAYEILGGATLEAVQQLIQQMEQQADEQKKGCLCQQQPKQEMEQHEKI